MVRRVRALQWMWAGWVLLLCASCASAEPAVSLQHCTIVLPSTSPGPLRVAAEVLSEEVERRTNLHWAIGSTDLAGDCTIELGVVDAKSVTPMMPEGFTIRTRTGPRSLVQVTGADSRGVLFGVGYLLRQFEMRAGSVTIPPKLKELAGVQSPVYPIRGHQLGYRPKNNTFDGWSPEQFDRYIRDLAVFGTNTIELIPPRSDDAATSPLYTLPPLEMMETLSRTIDHYGLNCSIWYPALDKDYSDPAEVAHAVEEWGRIFRALPRVDAVFVPGGDPGHTEPKYLFGLLEQVAAELHKSHSNAQMWVSPQSFSAAWLEEFYALLAQHPAWLTGVVYGPEMRENPEQFRRNVPASYPIRFYPDITHTAAAQYPVPDWDAGFALTEGREPVNPRPVDEGILFHRYAPLTDGFVAYSEGSNDDVNKVLWSAWGWDPAQSASHILAEYGRYFVAPDVAVEVAHGIEGLEQNWRGPLIENVSIPATLKTLDTVAQMPGVHVQSNWRLQQLLYRANYDGYLQERARHDRKQQEQGIAALEQLAGSDPAEALLEANKLVSVTATCADSILCRRAGELAGDLFRTIRMQLSVPRFQALAVDRGANLDTIDAPIDDLPWLREQLLEATEVTDDAGRRHAIDSILATLREPRGVLRDKLGIPGQRAHLLSGSNFAQDPSGLTGVNTAADYNHQGAARPLTQLTYAGTLYDLPLQMLYVGLDSRAAYKLRVFFAGRGTAVRLRANGQDIRANCGKHEDCSDAESDLPMGIAHDGKLLLEWSGSTGLGGNGRYLRIRSVELRPESGGNSGVLP